MHVLIHHCINDTAAGEEAAAAAAILLLIPNEHTILSAPRTSAHAALFSLFISVRPAADGAAASALLSGSPAEERRRTLLQPH